jgi:trimeric autotransporter adhesin
MFSLTARTRTNTILFILFLSLLCCFSPALSFGQGNEYNSTGTNAVVTLTSATSCTIPTNGNPAYTMDKATASSGVPAGCISGTHYDVWFKFDAANTTETVTIGHFGGNITNSEVQIFSGTSYTNFVSLACGATSATATSLTVNTTYYIRVSNVGSDPSGSGQSPKFDICLTHPIPPPSNDDCSGAVTLLDGVTNSSGTVWSATATSGISTGCATGTPDDDVWYKFSAPAATATVTLNPGTDLASSGANIQVFSGSCGSLTSIACGTTSLSLSGLTTGVQYYLRVYSAGAGPLSGTSSGSAFSINVSGPPTLPSSNYQSGRMNEVFKQTKLDVLSYPWEITYGPDDNLWITEARGYKVYRMDPNTGVKTTILDLNSTSTDLSAWGADSLRAVGLTSTSNWNSSAGNWPQGGLAGLAIHPKFGDGTGLHDFVYISYVHRYLATAAGSAGIFFRNKIVRFTYNSATGKLGTPAVVCDTIPGGQDHNSQRMIIAPVSPGGTNYLFYAAGDMGAGQFSNRMRPENAQHPESYEGKILRFNLEPDGDGGVTVPNAWIPNDNPYNAQLGKQSAVYSIGIRNNQGFAYDTSLNILYGSSHGPYSDDEINVIEPFRNYGHPLIEGFVDGNYNGNSVQGTTTSISAGAAYTDNTGISTCPPIGNEATNKAAIDSNGNGLYKDPLFSAYAATQATVANIWKNNPGNATPAPGWPTEAWSGLDFYSNTLIPGWKRSLVAASLKWGRLLRLRLDATGIATAPTNTVSDTISYFGSTNRFRDLAFSPDGKDIFVILDNSSTTSGPGTANPVVPACAGCVLKYTFLGYNSDGSGKSMIPASIDVTAGTPNNCATGTTITIDNDNNNLWVPITGPDGNIMAEIKANGNNLGTVTSTFYTNTNPVREDANKNLYLDRNMTITPQTQPASPVSIRLYLTSGELAALGSAVNSQGASSGVTDISKLSIFKNSDACGPAINNGALNVSPIYAEAHGTGGYVLQASISSFSSFYFGNSSATFPTLPLQLLSFKGDWKNNAAYLQWETANESNTSHFIVERSNDGNNFNDIGTVAANGNSTTQISYAYTDNDAASQPSPVIYYRLKLVDINGRSTYSKIISIHLSNNLDVVLFPNPVNDKLNIKINNRGRQLITVEVTDLQGRIMISEKRFINQNALIEIDVKKWKPQLYLLKVLNNKNEIITVMKFGKM